jgi:hypothetical protein
MQDNQDKEISTEKVLTAHKGTKNPAGDIDICFLCVLLVQAFLADQCFVQGSPAGCVCRVL